MKMTVKEFKDYILKFMSAEEALEKLLATQVKNYEKQEEELKDKDAENEDTSHYFMLIQAAKNLGWDIMVEQRDTIRGLSIGTPDYLEENIKQK